MNTVAPRLVDWSLAAAAPFLQAFQRGAPPAGTAGNLFTPQPDAPKRGESDER
jgi:hypothetical protein